jgi:hypothetical protein
MTGRTANSETTGSNMEWQESYSQMPLKNLEKKWSKFKFPGPIALLILSVIYCSSPIARY